MVPFKLILSCLGTATASKKHCAIFSGKGINVSLALNQLGSQVKSVCLGHADGEAASFFSEKDMDVDLIAVPGKVRVNIKLFESVTGRMTEFNEKGEPMQRSTVENVLCAVKRIMPTTSFLILGGSVPPGFPDDFYCTLGKIAHEHRVPFLLDATGSFIAQRNGRGSSTHQTKRRRVLCHLWCPDLVPHMNFSQAITEFCRNTTFSTAQSLSRRKRCLAAHTENCVVFRSRYTSM